MQAALKVNVGTALRTYDVIVTSSDALAATAAASPSVGTALASFFETDLVAPIFSFLPPSFRCHANILGCALRSNSPCGDAEGKCAPPQVYLLHR